MVAVAVWVESVAVLVALDVAGVGLRLPMRIVPAITVRRHQTPAKTRAETTYRVSRQFPYDH